MNRRQRPLGLTAIAVLGFLLLPSTAFARGNRYVDRQYGFEIDLLKDWTQTPIPPGEQALEAAKFKDDRDRDFATLSIFRFEKQTAETTPGPDEIDTDDLDDLKKKLESGELKNFLPDYMKSAEAYLNHLLERYHQHYGKKFEGLGKGRSVKIDDEKGQIWTWEFDHPRIPSASEFLMAGLVANEREEYVILYNCPKNQASRRRQREFMKSIASFEFGTGPVDLHDGGPKGEVLDKDAELLDPVKRQKIKDQLIESWRYIDAPHYIIIYNCDRKLALWIAEELEWMRTNAYEKVFQPPEPIQEAMVVRICNSMDEYHHYGGPMGSAGYWYSRDDEFVFPDLTTTSEEMTLGVLKHEGFHQYIYYALLKHSPPIWFNEGFAEYFYCAEHKGRDGLAFKKRHNMRYGVIKNALGSGKLYPIDRFVRLSRGEFMQNADLCYAQGWAFWTWLKNVTRNERYQQIPVIFFNEMQKGYIEAAKPPETEDEKKVPDFIRERQAEEQVPKQAFEKAFEGIDFEKLNEEFLNDLKRKM